MRLENFQSTGVEPLGEGVEKKVFINPNDERKVISERKEGIEEETGLEKDTPRQMKARFYLTKIVHLLLPKNIPDIYQAKQSMDGTQTIDSERIEHSESHARLQEVNKMKGNTEAIGEEIKKELGSGHSDLVMKLSDLGFNIDETVGNYIKNKDGDVQYVETFNPWEKDVRDSKQLELLFDEEELLGAINSSPDEQVKMDCTKNLERLLVLFEEEKQELKNQPKIKTVENSKSTKELELRMEIFEASFYIEELHSIAELSDEEAMNHPVWTPAKAALQEISKKINEMWEDESVSVDKKSQLQAKYKILSKAVGIRNKGKIDHTR